VSLPLPQRLERARQVLAACDALIDDQHAMRRRSSRVVCAFVTFEQPEHAQVSSSRCQSLRRCARSL
jgi:hypothetical protein